MREKLVIIGNGMAPGRVLDELFDSAIDRYDITIFNAETRVNYDRIMLSPVLAGEKAFDDIVIHDDAWYARHGITLHHAALDDTKRHFEEELGLSRVYPPTTMPDEPIRDLGADIAARRTKKGG